MAVSLNNSIFIHVGRTGGYWVRDVLHESGLFKSDISHFHAMPHELMQEGLDDRPMFAFLRDPFAWLASAWVHHVNFSWSTDDLVLRSPTFEGFLERIIQDQPNYVRSIYEPVLDHCQAVGKTENLKSDLSKFIKEYEGVDISNIVEQLPANNKSSDFMFYGPASCSRTVLEKIYELNKDIFTRLGYEPNYEKFSRDVSEQQDLARTLLTAVYNQAFVKINGETKDEIEKKYAVDLEPHEYEYINANKALRKTYLPDNYVVESPRPILSYFYDTICFSVLALDSLKEIKRVLVIGDNDYALTSFLGSIGVKCIDLITTGIIPGSSSILKITKKFAEVNELRFVDLHAADESYDLIVITDQINRVNNCLDIFNLVGKKLKPNAHLVIHMDCLDAYNSLPIQMSLAGDYNPINKKLISLPNQTWLKHMLNHHGLQHEKNTTFIRMKLTIDEGCKYPELDIPGQYSNELERISAIAKLTAVFKKS